MYAILSVFSTLVNVYVTGSDVVLPSVAVRTISTLSPYAISAPIVIDLADVNVLTDCEPILYVPDIALTKSSLSVNVSLVNSPPSCEIVASGSNVIGFLL
ncbi:unknown [Eubacterium sp. CAG:603]|nr:unknown [Eubacterium sp. CAG:603]